MSTPRSRTALAALVLTGAIVSALTAATVQNSPVPTPVSSYRIVKTYPHDRRAFTQGLQYVNGVLYEGTGLAGQSTIRKVRLENGEVLQEHKIDPRHFGEGIVVWKSSLIQITWQSEIGFVYDLATFEQKKSFTCTGEDWGRTIAGARTKVGDVTDS